MRTNENMHMVEKLNNKNTILSSEFPEVSSNNKTFFASGEASDKVLLLKFSIGSDPPPYQILTDLLSKYGGSCHHLMKTSSAQNCPIRIGHKCLGWTIIGQG